MGCDIHTYAQKKVNDKWETIPYVPFDWRSYGMFAFLADVRNYSRVIPISEQRGLPEDFDGDLDPSFYHSHSWLTVTELLEFDYDQNMEDRRVARMIGPNVFSGGETADPGDGLMTTYREFLGEAFFEDLQHLQEIGAERIVFAFDN